MMRVNVTLSRKPKLPNLSLCRGCGTPHQIRGLKEVTGDDPTKAPGYDRLNQEAQEQIKLAFEHGRIPDKDFKGLDADRAKIAKRYTGEITNAERLVVDHIRIVDSRWN